MISKEINSSSMGEELFLKKLLFKEWCKRNDIKMFLFDWDDTLSEMREIFVQHTSLCCDFLASQTTISKERWKHDIEEAEKEVFEKYSVNPNKWNAIVEILGKKHGLSDETRIGAISIFKQIYETPPKTLEGTIEGLTFLKKSGIPFGIVTHANHDWTLKKYHWLDLKRFLDWDDVFVVDENGHKTNESWLQAIKYFGLQPWEVAVVGDSPRSDINPARKAGVKHVFLREPPIPRWSIRNQPIDSDVVIISSINDLANLGAEYLNPSTRPSNTTGVLVRGIFLSHNSIENF